MSAVTYVATWRGLAYVACVIEVFARRMVDWRVSSSLVSDCVLDALENQPDPSVFARATRLIRAMLAAPTAHAGLSADELVQYCERIAAASGGILGMKKISADERALLATIAASLKGQKP